MIGKLKGIVEEINLDHIILDVNGVGYHVFCSIRTAGKLSEGESASMLIETHVREDHIHLYGFADKEERKCFNTLLTVKGVGTRMALAILSTLPPAQLFSAINQGDKKAVQTVSGVGAKLAERIVVELKDKTANFLGAANTEVGSIISSDNEITKDALSALVNLGVVRNSAYAIIQQIIAEEPDISLDTLIRKSLQKSAGR